MTVQDSKEAMEQFMAAGGFDFPVMLEGEQAARAYGIQAIPTIVLIDPQGRVAETLIGGASAEELSRLVAALAG